MTKTLFSSSWKTVTDILKDDSPAAKKQDASVRQAMFDSLAGRKPLRFYEPAQHFAVDISLMSDPNVDLESLRQRGIHSLELAKREPAVTESANALANIAVETLVQMHGVDRETATQSIRTALGLENRQVSR
jgi:hypothetical protein